MWNDLTIAAFTAFLTVLTLVLGKIIEVLFIDPVNNLKKTIGEVAFAVSYYANIRLMRDQKLVINNDEEIRLIEKELRRLACNLRSTAQVIPFYNMLSRCKMIPPEVAIAEGSVALIGWSNSLYQDDDPGAVGAFRSQIITSLSIKYQ